MENIFLGNIKEKKIPILVDLRVLNPNNYNIKIKRASFDLYINDQHLGNSNSTQKIVLKKEKEGVYRIPIETTASEISKSIFSSLSFLLGKDQILKIDGVIVVKALGLKKKFDISESQPVNAASLLKKK